MRRSREDLAWAAGLYEGEGSCNRRSEYRRIPRLELCQVDREPLEKFQHVVGVGRLYGPYSNKPGRKPYSVWHSSTFEAAQAVAAMLWPWLSRRRKHQIREAFLGFAATPPRKGGPKRKEAQTNA